MRNESGIIQSGEISNINQPVKLTTYYQLENIQPLDFSDNANESLKRLKIPDDERARYYAKESTETCRYTLTPNWSMVWDLVPGMNRVCFAHNSGGGGCKTAPAFGDIMKRMLL